MTGTALPPPPPPTASPPPPPPPPPEARQEPRRWIGGVCARIARDTGIPVAIIRITWLVVIGLFGQQEDKAPAYIFIGVYALLWFTMARPSQPAEPVRGPAAAMPFTPQATAPGERPYLAELVNYLWSSPTTPAPLYSFWTHGFVASDLPVRHDDMLVNTRLIRMPYGRVIVWPGWLVFVTESHNRPGELPPANRMWSVALDFIREYRRYTSWFRLLRTAHARLTKEERDRLRGVLANPNSIIVPLATVRELHQERWMMSPRLVVTTTDGRELMLGPNGLLEIGLSFWRLLTGFFGRWHPRFQELLTTPRQER